MVALNAKPYLRAISLARKVDADAGRYPFSIPAVRDMGVIQPHRDVTFFVGENGAGKSTILEAIAVGMGLPARGGARQALRPQLGASALHQWLRLEKGARQPHAAFFLRAESVLALVSDIDAANAVEAGSGESLHARSHGETFIEILLGLSDNGFYLLDEPEAALSPNRQLAALLAIHQLVQRGSQFVIATHSPILLAYPNAKILCFDETGVREVAYEDTEHYAVTRDFLNHYERRLQQLLDDGQEAPSID